MELLDVVLGVREVFPRTEDGLHHFGVACYLLFVAACERSNVEVGQQPLDLAIRQLAAFNPGGGADALNGGHVTEGAEPLWGKRAQSSPGTLELVDRRNEVEDLGRDLERVEREHSPYLHPKTPKSQT